MKPHMIAAYGVSFLWFATSLNGVPLETDNVVKREDCGAPLCQTEDDRPSSEDGEQLQPKIPLQPPSSSPDIKPQRAAMKIYTQACNKKQKKVVKEAWSEAGKLANAHSQWTPPGWFSSGKYQKAMDMYIGTDSKNDASWGGLGYGPLQSNILRQKGIHETSEEWSPSWSYAYFYCDETKLPEKNGKKRKLECNNPSTPGKSVVAYTFSDNGVFWNNKYVVLCPKFFSDDMLSLSDMVENAKKKPELKTKMDPWRKTRARSVFHETYHWGKAEVSDPICDRRPEIYAPSKVVQLAKDENVAGSKTNAESFAQAAMAFYLQQTFSLKSPPGPETAEVADDIEETFLTSVPDWFDTTAIKTDLSGTPMDAGPPL